MDGANGGCLVIIPKGDLFLSGNIWVKAYSGFIFMTFIKLMLFEIF
jgi:hypothetical protein